MKSTESPSPLSYLLQSLSTTPEFHTDWIGSLPPALMHLTYIPWDYFFSLTTHDYSGIFLTAIAMVQCTCIFPPWLISILGYRSYYYLISLHTSHYLNCLHLYRFNSWISVNAWGNIPTWLMNVIITWILPDQFSLFRTPGLIPWSI